jgi:beta-lactamase superfamily II metal-dependent hydrolase
MIRYVKRRWTTPLFRDSSGEEKKIDLLWGDRVRVIDQGTHLWKIKARGVTGFVNPIHLGTRSYLELYFIDVGQGDGVLIRTPDNRHILIDGGWPRKSQPTGKNAADFVDWKFFRDYEKNAIDLDAMICSHNDQDHYGGLWDLLDETQHEELDSENVHVEAFYHAGLSWWKGTSGRTLGPFSSTTKGPMWTRLLEARDSLEAGLRSSGSQPKLQGEWASFLRKVVQAKTRSGSPTPVIRLSDRVEHMQGFGEGDDVAIKVIAPVEFDVSGKTGIRKFSGGTSKNTNGNSVLLRLDYKSVRILLTGDLNTASQLSLLKDYANRHDIFECDVAKACHHGSDDVSIRFLEALKPACTIISSGDSEGHDHPRPNIIAASGLSGFRTLKNDKLITPLVFSTELARSIALGKVNQVDRLNAQNQVVEEILGDKLDRYKTRYKITMAGDRAPKSGSAKINKRRIAAKTTYGLINIRTDGRTVMCAALNEREFEWNVTTFKARF